MPIVTGIDLGGGGGGGGGGALGAVALIELTKRKENL